MKNKTAVMNIRNKALPNGEYLKMTNLHRISRQHHGIYQDQEQKRLQDFAYKHGYYDEALKNLKAYRNAAGYYKDMKKKQLYGIAFPNKLAGNSNRHFTRITRAKLIEILIKGGV